ncbi:hypothetical protein [Desulfogranum japonicum]|uniref:hypothetical protein n=1 Tax=Desulfogranum japonicum TaxID=231447 RepID=UPI0012947462|nr:hypothetical protein [Desulfogranum japonicum]
MPIKGSPNRQECRELLDLIAKKAVDRSGCSEYMYVLNYSRYVDDLISRYPDCRTILEEAVENGDYATAEDLERMREEQIEDGLCCHGLPPECCPLGCGDL